MFNVTMRRRDEPIKDCTIVAVCKSESEAIEKQQKLMATRGFPYDGGHAEIIYEVSPLTTVFVDPRTTTLQEALDKLRAG